MVFGRQTIHVQYYIHILITLGLCLRILGDAAVRTRERRRLRARLGRQCRFAFLSSDFRDLVGRSAPSTGTGGVDDQLLAYSQAVTQSAKCHHPTGLRLT